MSVFYWRDSCPPTAPSYPPKRKITMTNLSLDTLLEQARIQSVLNLYATALDARDWAALDGVFTADASANYGELGEFRGRQAIVDLVSHVLNQCGPTQHLLGTYRIAVDGD